MATTPNSAILPQTPRSAVAQIEGADGTNLKALVEGGSNNSKVSAILASSTDTTARTLQLVRNVGGTNTGGTVSGGANYLISSVAIPASAGNVSATAPVAVTSAATIPGLASDGVGNGFLYVNSGEFLCVAISTGAVTLSEVISVHATVADF
jgi:hypothetical protein